MVTWRNNCIGWNIVQRQQQQQHNCITLFFIVYKFFSSVRSIVYFIYIFYFLQLQLSHSGRHKTNVEYDHRLQCYVDYTITQFFLFCFLSYKAHNVVQNININSHLVVINYDKWNNKRINIAGIRTEICRGIKNLMLRIKTYWWHFKRKIYLLIKIKWT